MKTHMIIFIISTCLVISVAAQTENECIGAVGDVKYSVLPPDDFQQVNGNCWVLADGRNISSSTLGALGFSHAIDPRGRFIRSKEDRSTDGRDKGRGYADNVGSVQTASQRFVNLYADPIWETPFYGTAKIEPNNTWTRHLTTGWGRAGTAPKDGIRFKLEKTNEEIRPENISLFTYIRIN